MNPIFFLLLSWQKVGKEVNVMIPVAEPYLGERELEYVTECIKTGWISSIGKYVTKFEEEFSKFCGVKYGVATSNGTTALHLALVSLGIGKGNEVIVPTLTFVAVANAVTYTGAKPVFVDSEPTTWNIDPDKIEKAITKRSRAIIPVHLYGHPANMDSIMDVAKKYRLFVIEDAAEAHGALYKGKKAGSFGDMSCFSFYGNKIITTGEGGMVLTNSAKLNKRLRFLKNHGMSKTRRYYHPEIGFNYRLTNVQSALGLAQLERIDETIAKKRKDASLYNKLLEGIKGIILPPEEAWARNVYWMYSVLINEKLGLSRDKLMMRLREKGIDTRPLFIPMHQLPPHKCKGNFPVADRLSSQGMNLPSSAKLKKKEIKYICETIKNLSIKEKRK